MTSNMETWSPAKVAVSKSMIDSMTGIDDPDDAEDKGTGRKLFTPNAFSNILLGFQVAVIILYATCTEFDHGIAAPALGTSGELSGPQYAMFQDTHIMMLIGFGFLYTLLHRYSWSGVALNYILTVVTIQWAILTQGFWLDVSNYRRGISAIFPAIPLNIAALINADYTAATVLISFGAVIGRVSPTQLVFMTLCEVVFSTANVIIGVNELGVNDPGGSMLIHVFGAAFGLAVAYMVGDKSKHSKPKTSLTNGTFAMIGTLFLFAFWPSFNAAMLVGPGQHRAVFNTVIAISCSAVTAFLLSRGIHGGQHLDMEHIQNSTLAGGVAIGAACNMLLHPWGAMLTGVMSGAVSAYGFTFLVPIFAKLGIRDFCGIMDLHLIPGLIGGVASAIAAASIGLNSAASDSIAGRFSPESLAENFPMWNGRTGMQQGALQLAQTFISLGFGTLSGVLVGWCMTRSVFEPKTGFFYKDDADWGIHMSRVMASRVALSRAPAPDSPPLGAATLRFTIPARDDSGVRAVAESQGGMFDFGGVELSLAPDDTAVDCAQAGTGSSSSGGAAGMGVGVGSNPLAQAAAAPSSSAAEEGAAAASAHTV